MSVASFYGNKSYNPFGTKGPFYSKDVGHRGDDYGAAVGQGIPSWVDGVVMLVGYSSGLGYVIAVKDTLTGVFMGQAHLRGTGKGRDPKLAGGLRVGDRVRLGDFVGYATGRGEDTGSLWDGSHSHTTAGWTVRIAFGEGVINPRPHIENGIRRSQLANTSPATPTAPTPTPVPQEEDDMFSDNDRKVLNGLYGQIEKLFNEKLGALQEILIQIMREEGTDGRVFYNEDSGIYAVGGLGYWWNFGDDIFLKTIDETRAARKEFGELTLALYRRRGFAQKAVHSMKSQEWDFLRGVCRNFPANVNDERVAAILEILNPENKKEKK